MALEDQIKELALKVEEALEHRDFKEKNSWISIEYWDSICILHLKNDVERHSDYIKTISSGTSRSDVILAFFNMFQMKPDKKYSLPLFSNWVLIEKGKILIEKIGKKSYQLTFMLVFKEKKKKQVFLSIKRDEVYKLLNPENYEGMTIHSSEFKMMRSHFTKLKEVIRFANCEEF